MAKKKTEADLISALAKRYQPPAYAFMPQVRNGTGYTREKVRTADALALSLYPSRGLDLMGFEIKVDRSDWLRELKEPNKSESIQQFCDQWWIVTLPDVIVPGELPSAWGHMVLKGSQLVAEVKAPKLEAAPMDRPMLCGIMRKVTEASCPLDDVQRRVDEAYQKGFESGQKDRTREREIVELKRRINEFQEASGVEIDRWSGGHVGEAVRFVVDNQLLGTSDIARRFRAGIAFKRKAVEQLASKLDEVSRALDAIEAANS